MIAKLVLAIYICATTGMFFGTIKDFHNIAVTLTEIYKCNDFNMFACVILFLVMFFLNPLFCIGYFMREKMIDSLKHLPMW